MEQNLIKPLTQEEHYSDKPHDLHDKYKLDTTLVHHLKKMGRHASKDLGKGFLTDHICWIKVGTFTMENN
ncbi:hypothetical protein DSO57_1038782 [Entomophthora muscae]|uniref:Uncharacterized protein n=1 Tax=Entomophthora muscae TaxID=34485 RepID=A0ACC2U909_9FUNG|nr:hypothetical protein DSO57_1038782 [Entomophthora muscae]